MKRLLLISSLLISLVASSQWLWAQETNYSAQRAWGAGVRFLPSALSPIAPYGADPSLGTAITLQYWVGDLVGIEAGGWMSSFKDTWSDNSTTLISGALLYKLANGAQADFYVVGRGVSLNNISTNRVFYEPTPPPVEPQPEPTGKTQDVWPCPIYGSRGSSPGAAAKAQNGMVPYCPWPGGESRSSTLALEAAGGIEWSLSSQFALNIEFGMIYAQIVTTSYYPAPPPLPWPPDGPKPLEQPQTYASSSLGLILHFAANFYF